MGAGAQASAADKDNAFKFNDMKRVDRRRGDQFKQTTLPAAIGPDMREWMKCIKLNTLIEAKKNREARGAT